MVFGESAGAVDACALITSPLAGDHFAAVLLESGSCVALEMPRALEVGAEIAAVLGCPTDETGADCLRDTDGAAIVAAQPQVDLLGLATTLDALEVLPFGPTVDGHVLPAQPVEILAAGDHTHVPFIVGSNAEETGPAIGFFLSDADYAAAVHERFGTTDGDVLLAMYPSATYGSPHGAMVALSTDVMFTCPARHAAAAAAGSQDEPVRRYLFSHALEGALVQGLGAFHALELVFLFQQTSVPTYDLSEAELALGDEMLGYWARFAGTGNPSGDEAVAWPTYDDAERLLILDTPIVAGDSYRAAECDLIDSLTR